MHTFVKSWLAVIRNTSGGSVANRGIKLVKVSETARAFVALVEWE